MPPRRDVIMTTIRQYYQIMSEIEFVDVHVDADNLIFLDLHAIRLAAGPEPFRSEALVAADAFLSELTDSIVGGGAARTARARDLLCNFREPWQTRFGMSVVGYFGRGGAAGTGAAIWDALTTDAEALAIVGVLKRLEQLPLFVEGVGADICSDLTTRIIFAALAKFTTHMMTVHPELRVGAVRTTTTVWDPIALRWVSRELTLPAPEGRPLLLVPVGWARRNPLMTASRFHGVSVLGYVQDSEAAYSPTTGRLLKTSKLELRRRSDLRDVHGANIRKTLEALSQNENLVAAFEAYLLDWYRRQGDIAA